MIACDMEVWQEVRPGDLRKIATVHRYTDEDRLVFLKRVEQIADINFASYYLSGGPCVELRRHNEPR